MYVCISMLMYNKMNENDDTRDRREKSGLLCYHKVLTLTMKPKSVR